MSTALTALDSTVVTTAVPSIVRNLGGFDLFPWLFSIYLLTQAVTVPIYGRMSDVFGRKPMLYIGIGLFLLGSVLCGVAWNMGSLIAFRGLQGLGAGAIVPMVQTIVGDLYVVKERARITGYTASVWGVSSVLGPLLGGLFSQYASWRWIFYLNLPIGALAFYLLERNFHETIERKEHRIDYAGAMSLTLGFSAVIFGLLQGGSLWPWSSPKEIAVFVLGGVSLVAFTIVERHAAEPMVPLWVFARRPLLSGNLANILVGAVLLGLTSYIPTWAQGVRRLDPLVSGLAVASITLGWPVAAGFAGRLYLRIGFRSTALVGGTLTTGGAALFIFVRPGSQVLLIALFGLVVGAGLGLVSTPVLVGLQSLVGWERRGVVTASNMFSRSVGSAVGIALFGSIANSSLAHWLSAAPASISRTMPNSINIAAKVLGGGKVSLAPNVAAYVRTGLYHATHDVFVGIVVVAIFGLVAISAIPRHLTPLSFGDEALADEFMGDPPHSSVEPVG
jgi:EmrB/QacA subfamily drug resistance transporter